MSTTLSPARKNINATILALSIIPLWLLADFGLSVAAHHIYPAWMLVPIIIMLGYLYGAITHWQR
ncbi:hypothetical protein C1Y63_04815 [Corynebacterium sp. 13CS0277]|uniref:hypothetical protein n=1 Tax=Corynebacterium sp. 13CS0277 TaxID=2071994 RepID=UPI000D024665|nr:hypothetical protein [Corynebacterium sp. 13CS0277]PRQ11733.1 hypothetical protein C1Y63_04815 [Corynebacterium sp. 13CS0277]